MKIMNTIGEARRRELRAAGVRERPATMVGAEAGTGAVERREFTPWIEPRLTMEEEDEAGELHDVAHTTFCMVW